MASESKEEEKRNQESGVQPGPCCTTTQKAVPIGDHLYAARSGCTGWSIPIIEKLTDMVQGENLTPRQCAAQAASEYRNEEYKLTPDWQPINGFDIKKQNCGLTFASYNVANPTVVFAGRNTKGVVTIKEIVDSGTDKVVDPTTHNRASRCRTVRTFNCHGSGARFAKEKLKKHLSKISTGLDEELHGMILLKALRYACKKDPHSGGVIRVVLLTTDGVTEMYEEKQEDLKEILKYYKYRQRLQKRHESKKRRHERKQWLKVYKRIKPHK
ncbi:hypothetical protein C5167_026928, partial [Papaver somniferum]